MEVNKIIHEVNAFDPNYHNYRGSLKDNLSVIKSNITRALLKLDESGLKKVKLSIVRPDENLFTDLINDLLKEKCQN